MSLKQRIAAFINPEQVKINPAYAGMIMYSNEPQTLQTPRNYKAFASEGFGNDTVYKCVSYISRNGAAIPPKLYTDATMQTEITKHPLLDKLKTPNNEQSGVGYREACLAYKLLSGNNYQYALRAAKSGPPDELWTLRPDKVEIVASRPRGIVGYKYEDFDTPILPEQIGHTRYWNPDSEVYGLSPIQIAGILIDMQTGARNWDLGLLQNMAKPPGAWTVPTTLSKNARETLEKKLKEKMSGARNAGTAPVLDGGLQWTSIGLPPSELDWLEGLQYNAVLIANIYNMPPQLVGDTSSSTYANVQEAKAASYTEAIFPELDDFYALANVWLVPMYPDLCDARGMPAAYLYYDKQSVEVVQAIIQAQKTAQAQRAIQAYTQGACTLNESKVMQGLPEIGPAGDVYRIGQILIMESDLMKYAEQSLRLPSAPPAPLPESVPVPVPAPGTPPVLPNDQTVDADNPGPGKAVSPLALPRYEKPNRATKALDLQTAEQKQAHYDAIEAMRTKLEAKAEQQLHIYFSAQQKDILASINAAAIPSTAILRAETALKKSKDDGQQLLLKLAKETAGTVGSQISKQLKSGIAHEHKDAVQDFINEFGPDVLTYLLQQAGQNITQINATTLAQIQSELSDGVAAGESIPALAKRIDNLYLEQIIPNRSKTIARTETTSASNYGSIQAAKQSGLTLTKVWLATPDSRTREDHAEADGQEVGIDEAFEVGGEQLAYPGDPAGSASNIISCRCTTFYNRVKAAENDDSSDEDEEKIVSMRPHKRRHGNDYQRWMEETLG